MRVACTITALLIAATLSVPAFGEPQPAYVVIVHPENTIQAIDRKFLADVFLKKVTRWDTDEVAQPVDREPGSALRERFSGEMLARSLSAVKSYWQQLIFSGRALPPPEVVGDDQVVAYVLRHRGAVGYVTAGTDLKGAKLLTVR